MFPSLIDRVVIYYKNDKFIDVFSCSYLVMIFFIYDPEQRHAFFTEQAVGVEVVSRVKNTVQLNMIPSNCLSTPVIPILHSSDGTPLLKSNLQKAIRRCETDVALQTAILLLQRDPMEMLRRLPIIAVEDVSLIDSFPVMVWLMMAGASYRLTTHDIDTVLHIVWTLSEARQAVEYTKCTGAPDISNISILTAVYYRWKYGGMKGDLELLHGVIRYHNEHNDHNNNHILTTRYKQISYDKIAKEPIVLVESIDFHPFPAMLTHLSLDTGLTKDVIREWIWKVDSRINERKAWTHTEACRYRNTPEWRMIEPCLDDVRMSFLT
jgi:hypothetical protein